MKIDPSTPNRLILLLYIREENFFIFAPFEKNFEILGKIYENISIQCNNRFKNIILTFNIIE